MDQQNTEDELQVCRTALRQIEQLVDRQGTVLINGRRMTRERAILLITRWAQQGITPSEILLCENANLSL